MDLSQAPTQLFNSLEQDPVCSPGGGSACSAGGGSASPASDSSAGKMRAIPNKRYKKGKRMRFGDKTEPMGTIPKHWRDCENKSLTETSDSELTGFLIGYAVEFTLPQTFYPWDKGQWVVSCSDTRKADSKDVSAGFVCGLLLMICQIINCPNSKKINTGLKIPMSCKYSIRTAIQEANPAAVKVKDLLNPPISPPKQNSKFAKFSKYLWGSVFTPTKINQCSRFSFVAFTGITCIVSVTGKCYCFPTS